MEFVVLAFSMTLERGYLLHKRYRILEVLGQGGMGSVYRALDENLGIEVAVKENLFTTEEYARQFRLEAVILANLRHPNLPRVTDHFVVSGQGQYLVMDFIEGEDLRQRMERQGTISDQEVILIGAAICDALTYLHTCRPPVIHRDLKPGNIRITPDGRIYLVDFGLAKIVRGTQATTTGARAMTPGYSPPEQYGTARTDPRTDIYSLGATLYAALTGVIPEDGLARAMDEVELTPIRKHNPRVGRRLAAAIEKAMAIRPEDRFQTAEDFKRALLEAGASKTQRLNGEIVVEPPPAAITNHLATSEEKTLEGASPENPLALFPSTPISPPTPPRHRRLGSGCWVSLSFFLLTLLAGLVALWLFWPPIATALGLATTSPGAERSPVSLLKTATPLTPTMPIVIIPSSTPTPTITPTPTETLTPTITPQGGGYGQIAFASSRAGLPQIFLMNADGTNQRQLTGMPDGACQPDWSPDGKRIVFISPCPNRQDMYREARLYILDLDSGDVTELPTESGGDFEPDWSPVDPTRIAFTSLRDGTAQIYVLNLADNSVTRLSDGSQKKEYRYPAWSPTGLQILFTLQRPSYPWQIWVMSNYGKGPEQVVRSGTKLWDSMPVWSPDGLTILYTQTRSRTAGLGWLMTIPYAERGNEGKGVSGSTKAANGTYSPDGRWIAFESIDLQATILNYDIYLLPAEGGKRIRLTTDKGLDFDPAWRPAP